MYDVRTIQEAQWSGMEGFLGGNFVMELLKALEAGAGEAIGSAGGRAMQYESLDNVLQTVTLTQKNASLWRAITKKPIHATVDQFVRRTSMGEEWGIAVPESSNPADHLAELARAIATVKYYRSRREVSDVSMMVGMIENPETEEETAGTIQIIKRLAADMYWADQAVIPTQIDGFFSMLHAGHKDASKPQMISTDAEGKIITGRESFESLAAQVVNVGGLITHAFCNPLIAADFSSAYATAERIVIQPAAAGGLVEVGANVGTINTAQGPIAWEKDPFNKIGWIAPAAGDGVTGKPAAPTSVAGAAAGSDCAQPAGNYFYKVTAVNEYGESTPVASAVIAVTAGQHVTLTITNGNAAAAPAATGFRIYRSELDAASAADCRYLWQVALTATTTVYVDAGYFVPGTAHVLMLDMETADTAQQWSQLLPLTKKRLAETGPTRPFLLNLIGALRVAKPEWCAVYRNVLPRFYRDAGWDPLKQYAV